MEQHVGHDLTCSTMINRVKRLLLIFVCIAVLCLLICKLPSFSDKYHFREGVIDAGTGLLFQQQLSSYRRLSFTAQNVKETREFENEDTSVFASRTQSESSHINGKSGPDLGYIVAFDYYEQQTMAAGNLLQLQCFASKLNLSVVQPLMKKSFLLLPSTKDKASDMLKMDSVFDMEKWRKHTKSQGYAPLVPWKKFIEYAPRGVILVQMKYPTLTYIKQARKNGIEFPHPVSEKRDYERGCGYKFINRDFAELQVHHNFTLLGRVCYNFITGDLIPLKVYLRDLSSQGRRVTILMDEWRGIGSTQRVLVDERICTQSNLYREYTEYSPVLHEDAASYIKRHITNESEGHLAVMARYEMTGLTHRVKSSTDPHAVIPYCLKKTLEEIKSLKMSYRLNKVFVSMDIGKYGSKSFKVKKYFGHFKDMASFLKDAYQGKMDIKNWEKSFEDVARSKDAGYIANLQQLLVVKAKCVLFVGGGTFQKHALHMFQQLHRTPRAMCISFINECTSSIR